MRSTPVTAKLSRKFYDAMGDDVANELVDWFNAVDLTYHEPITQGAHSHLRHQGDALPAGRAKKHPVAVNPLSLSTGWHAAVIEIEAVDVDDSLHFGARGVAWKKLRPALRRGLATRPPRGPGG